MPDPRFSAADVRRYYDANTDAFIRHGQGGSAGAIHRAVWAPGVHDRDQAFRYVEDLIVREIDALASPGPVRVLDLGCGVGASLTYIARQRDVNGVGVTLSPLQARVGQQRVSAEGLGDRVRILEGDYCALPSDLALADVAYAIESFVHGPSPERFFAAAARALRPDGVLIVCDDIRTTAGGARADRTLAEFARGWHVNTLITASDLQRHAGRAGFIPLRTTDLTAYLELRRPRDRAIALLATLVRWLPWMPQRLAPLIGGSALQRGLARGWIAYHCAVFRRT